MILAMGIIGTSNPLFGTVMVVDRLDVITM
jgi:hypothetical protein